MGAGGFGDADHQAIDVRGHPAEQLFGHPAHPFRPVLPYQVMFPANIYASRIPNPPKSMTSRHVRTVEEVVYLAAAVVVGVGSIQ